MKGLVCKVCGYVALDGSKDQCPICLAKNEFEEKEDAYKMPDFKAVSGETEKKHIPYFTIVKECGIICGIGCIDVHVKIGEILHPSLPEHHIAEVTFYVDNKFVSNVMFTSNVNPATVIHLKDGTKGKVQAIENCNIHGKWYNEVEIK
ncbi:superoxide reductase [Endomicrobiia bacterium]|nr:superoxide reductase [Endomicrobiia bacterium]